MNTKELNQFLLKFPISKIFKGVFASDCLPSKVKLPFACIINLSSSTQFGSHWVSLYIDENGRCEYMDSYGLKPKVKYIIYFIKIHSKTLSINNIQLQHVASNTCGKYAAIFLLYKINGGTINNFSKLFSKNTFINDLTINNYFKYYTQNSIN